MTRDPTAVRMQPPAWAVEAKENGRQSGRFAEAGGLLLFEFPGPMFLACTPEPVRAGPAAESTLVQTADLRESTRSS